MITWLSDNSGDPEIQNLRWNKVQGCSSSLVKCSVRRDELEGGAAGKEFMSFLVCYSTSFTSDRVIVENISPQVTSSDSQREDWRLTNEEIIR